MGETGALREFGVMSSEFGDKDRSGDGGETEIVRRTGKCKSWRS